MSIFGTLGEFKEPSSEHYFNTASKEYDFWSYARMDLNGWEILGCQKLHFPFNCFPKS